MAAPQPCRQHSGFGDGDAGQHCLRATQLRLIRSHERCRTFIRMFHRRRECPPGAFGFLIFSQTFDSPDRYSTSSLPIRSPKMIAPSRGILSVMSISGTVPVRCVLVYMGSKSEYLASARECERRAQEMPPALRQTFVGLAEHWRKLASNAAPAADRRQIQEATDRRKKEG